MKQVVFKSRRQFVKTFALSTAFATLFGKPWLASFLAEMQPAGMVNAGNFSIRLSDFPWLFEEGGSLRLSVNRIGFDGFPQGNFYPIIINRGAGDQFYVLDSECTHASCVVGNYDRDFGRMVCPCHGSTYELNGTVISGAGGASQRPLRRLNYAFDRRDTLSIEVPGLGYSMTGATAETSVGPRFRIRFPTFPEVTYEIHFRSSVAENWAPIKFSLTETGAMTEEELVGNELTRTIYAPRAGQTGFYAVMMRVLDLTEF